MMLNPKESAVTSVTNKKIQLAAINNVRSRDLRTRSPYVPMPPIRKQFKSFDNSYSHRRHGPIT